MDDHTLLHQMSTLTPTRLWNDSCSIQELTTSIQDNGAVGATCNPVIVLAVLKKEWPLWKERLQQLLMEMPTATDEGVAWRLTEEMSQAAAGLLLPTFERENGKNGRLSIQTNPKFYRDAAAIVAQAERFSTLAPNMIVKIPVTQAGILAIEEATYRGVSINATVSFSVPQALQVAEAVERGLQRREREGRDISRMGPVCTLMVGRLDDWLKVVVEKDGVIVDPWVLDWAGVAVMKRAYALYQERGYRLRLLSAAFRNHLHWSEFIGGEVVISPPFEWQERFNRSGIPIQERMAIPVEPGVVAQLERHFEDFRRAYQPDGMRTVEFDEFGATRRTLRQFCKASEDLSALIRETLLPNPDLKS